MASLSRALIAHPALRFALVGGVNTLLDFAVFAALHYGFGMPILPAHICGFLLAVGNSYVMNRAWTFRDRSRGAEAWRRGALFALVALGGLGVSSLVIMFAALWLPAWLAKILATAASFVWNYGFSRRLVFKP